MTANDHLLPYLNDSSEGRQLDTFVDLSAKLVVRACYTKGA